MAIAPVGRLPVPPDCGAVTVPPVVMATVPVFA